MVQTMTAVASSSLVKQGAHTWRMQANISYICERSNLRNSAHLRGIWPGCAAAGESGLRSQVHWSHKVVAQNKAQPFSVMMHKLYSMHEPS